MALQIELTGQLTKLLRHASVVVMSDERGRLEESIEKLHGNIKVDLMGNLPHEKVMSFYKDYAVNLFVNVSKSEGLPVSIMEAVSFGIPVRAT